MSAVTPAFDEVVHAPIRLRICVMLAPVASAGFQGLREDLDVADSVLSKHLKTLSEAGYVSLRREGAKGKRPTTWVTLTKAGRMALNGHLAALEQLAAQASSVNADNVTADK